MSFDPQHHHRRSIRLPGYDYAQRGAYFITVCAHDRQPIFGQLVAGMMRLNRLGVIVRTCWRDLPQHYPQVVLDAFVVMPNHVHGIIVLFEMGAGFPSGLCGHPCMGTKVTAEGTSIDADKPAPTTNPHALAEMGAGFPSGLHRRPGMGIAPTVGGAPANADKPAPTTNRHALSEVVRAFKTYSARGINRARGTLDRPVWQRNYYEHIIRDDADLARIREYIENNPLAWDLDEENLAHHVGGL